MKVRATKTIPESQPPVRWCSVEDILRTLHSSYYLERVQAHLLLGWIPRWPDIEVKLAMGRDAYGHMERALLLRKYMEGRTRGAGGWDFSIPESWYEVGLEADRAATLANFLAGVYLDLGEQLERSYARVLDCLDPILDAHLIELVTPARAAVNQRRQWATKVLRAAGDNARVEDWGSGAGIRSRWADTGGRSLPESEWLVTGERAPVPARPPGMRRKVPGSLRRNGWDIRDPDHTIRAFHGNMDEEITAMELFARCSYEHPDMPAAFHLAMARQVSDESRHAAACEALCRELGARYGDHPIDTCVYDFHYQFAPCESGSKRELLWRLLLRSTVQEALSLDGFVVQIKKRLHYGQPRVARLLESIVADELFHVESGQRWSRYLCGDDEQKVIAEREAANACYFEHVNSVRRRFVEEHPDLALEEMDYVTTRRRREREENPYPFSTTIRVNRQARRAAGMSEEEIAQPVAWGYVLGEEDPPGPTNPA